ncbi:11183_t:CDS:1, partial [Funneliformis geosporum]
QAKINNLPADLGQIPNKISTGKGFFGFTADQWKTFILVYATPLLWDLLDLPDKEILVNFAHY